MNQQEINKYLTEQVFEECWHERDDAYPSTKVCIKCNNYYPNNNDFFSLGGCMKLWLKIQEMEWFDEFIYRQPLALLEGYCPVFGLAELIHPDRLAPAVYKFLQEE